MTIIFVLLILIALLRAIVAPLYSICSVVVSVCLRSASAVGADYNILLISRIRDDSPPGVRSGVIRTVASTGVSQLVAVTFGAAAAPHREQAERTTAARRRERRLLARLGARRRNDGTRC